MTEMSITENLVLTRYHDAEFSQGIRMKWDVAAARAKELVAAYDIRTNDPSQPASTLSGGNQQKVIVARELSRDIRLAVAAQPTRGIDVGSIEYVHEQIVRKREGGTAVLIVSTELDEIFALADRILVMFDGRIVAERLTGATTPTEIGLFMAGRTEEVASA